MGQVLVLEPMSPWITPENKNLDYKEFLEIHQFVKKQENLQNLICYYFKK